MNEPDVIVCDPEVNDVIQERIKLPKGIPLGRFMRQRAQDFLIANQPNSVVVMSDRKYQKLPDGWSRHQPEPVL
jgi:hypothetical protein